MAHSVRKLEPTPYFDLELLMTVSGETRVGGAVTERFMHLWEKWIPNLQARLLETDSGDYLAVWLSREVEEEVDAVWAASPSEGYLHNALAQVLCMSAVHGFIPAVEDAGCAPSPRPGEDLRAALVEAGLPYTASETLSRRYAVLTPHPFKGGCEICRMREACPKAQGVKKHSVVLPGFEQPLEE